MQTLKEEIKFIKDVQGLKDPEYRGLQWFKDSLEKISDWCAEIQYTSISKKYLGYLYEGMQIGYLIIPFESEADEAKRLAETIHSELAESGASSVYGSHTAWLFGSILGKLELLGVTANNHNLVNIKKAVNDAYSYTAALAESMQGGEK